MILLAQIYWGHGVFKTPINLAQGCSINIGWIQTIVPDQFMPCTHLTRNEYSLWHFSLANKTGDKHRKSDVTLTNTLSPSGNIGSDGQERLHLRIISCFPAPGNKSCVSPKVLHLTVMRQLHKHNAWMELCAIFHFYLKEVLISWRKYLIGLHDCCRRLLFLNSEGTYLGMKAHVLIRGELVTS